MLGKQALGLALAAVFAFVLTYVIGMIIHKTIGLRVSEEDEFTGLDLSRGDDRLVAHLGLRLLRLHEART